MKEVGCQAISSTCDSPKRMVTSERLQHSYETASDHSTATADKTDPGLGFASMEDEVRAARLPVTGRCPPGWSGTLVRTPAKFESGRRPARATGSTGWRCCTRSRFAGRPGVGYANRFLGARRTAASATAGPAWREFATDPCRTLFQRVPALFSPKLTDNGNVNVDPARRALRRDDRDAGCRRVRPGHPGDARRAGTRPGQGGSRHRPPAPRPTAARPSATRLQFGPAEPVPPLRHDRRPRDAARVGRAPRRASPPTCTPSASPSATSVLAELPARGQPAAARARRAAVHRELRLEAGARHALPRRRPGDRRAARPLEADAFFAFHHVNAFEDDGRGGRGPVAYPDAGDHRRALPRPPALGSADPATGELRRFRPAAGDGTAREAVSATPASSSAHRLPRAATGGRTATSTGRARARPATSSTSSSRSTSTGGTAVTWHEDGLLPGRAGVRRAAGARGRGRRRAAVGGARHRAPAPRSCSCWTRAT